MLRSLHVKNIALIDDCTLVFGPKLNVLSGETGAGKSVLIDSLGFALGARADKGLIRHGQTLASVEAVFDLSDAPNALRILEEMGVDTEDKMLIVYRTMSETKNDIRMNGRLVTLSMLKEVAAVLVDILGQHEHQSLLSVSTHISLLDKYGEKAIAELKKYVESLYSDYKDICARLSSFGDESERIRKLDLLKYQIDEIKNAELQEGEEEELLSLRDKYRNAEKIINAVATSKSAIDGDDSYSVLSALSTSMTALRHVASYDKDLESSYERLDAAYTELKDIIGDLESYLDGFDFDQGSSERIERRVDLIRTLKRKYGTTISEILSHLEKCEEEYASLSNATDEIIYLEEKKSKVYALLLDSCAKLSKVRISYAASLRKEIEKELGDLGMKGSLFEVKMISGEEYLSSDGFDSVEFMISPNPGEPLRSLSKIISGGEMSRFMLALKVITARLDGISTLVFDEIDTGISGKIGAVVAEKLMMVSTTRQVLVITHLPQVAAMSDDHYLIAKRTENEKTYTTITKLDESGVVGEVERLSAGVGEYGTLHAKELRSKALSLKRTLLRNNYKLI